MSSEVFDASTPPDASECDGAELEGTIALSIGVTRNSSLIGSRPARESALHDVALSTAPPHSRAPPRARDGDDERIDGVCGRGVGPNRRDRAPARAARRENPRVSLAAPRTHPEMCVIVAEDSARRRRARRVARRRQSRGRAGWILAQQQVDRRRQPAAAPHAQERPRERGIGRRETRRTTRTTTPSSSGTPTTRFSRTEASPRSSPSAPRRGSRTSATATSRTSSASRCAPCTSRPIAG